MVINEQNQVIEILSYLKDNLVPFHKITNFSQKPGIYTIGFVGNKFPLNSAHKYINHGDIIYIGKAEDSQESRDAKGHFLSDKSGSSTVRRSLGAILRQELQLLPIPRSDTETSERRFTNYKFTLPGENSLTEWMKCNLSLSYWEYEGGIIKLRNLEKTIIKLATPILNIKDNPANRWTIEIKLLRKNCKELAKLS